jgi:hypothetical protein
MIDHRLTAEDCLADMLKPREGVRIVGNARGAGLNVNGIANPYDKDGRGDRICACGRHKLGLRDL